MNDVAWQDFCNGLDKRTHFYDLVLEPNRLVGKAERSLQAALEHFATQHGLASAIVYLEPFPYQLRLSQQPLHAQPDASSATVNEVLHGEALSVVLEQDGWCLVRRDYDSYLGWLPRPCLQESVFQAHDEVVTIEQLRGHLYAEPRVSAPRLATLACPMRFKLCKQPNETLEQTDWLEVMYQQGKAYLHRSMLKSDAKQASLLQRAESFLGVPYVWGGVTAWGLDCSGFVQLLFRLQGIALPRDADQQRRYCQRHAQEVSLSTMQAGDLLFFQGHVALCHQHSPNKATIIHANGKHMRVTVDDLASAYGQELQAILQGVYRLTRDSLITS